MVRSDKPTRAAGVPSLAGVLVVDKPVGMSSMAAVAEVRRRAGGLKTGHAGTLDPLASGVLVIALGRATKIIETLMATDKRYRTRIDLSAFTPTDDLESSREEVRVNDPPREEAVREATLRFTGEIQQRPPAHSAVKVNGRRAYKLARGGAAPDLPPRPVVMHALALVGYEWPFLDLDLHCGKGLYVRSLARDLGQALGTGGHCVSIRRTAVGPFTIERALPLDDVPRRLTSADVIATDRALEMVNLG